MKKTFYLAFCTLSFVMSYSFTYINSTRDIFVQKGNKKIQSLETTQNTTRLLTKQDIINSYYKGLNTGTTHMLIVWDTFDYDDYYDFIVYCNPYENVVDLVNYYTVPGYYRVSAVYTMNLDIEEQINERHPWNIEYPDKKASKSEEEGFEPPNLIKVVSFRN